MNLQDLVGKKVTISGNTSLGGHKGVIIQVDENKPDDWKFRIRVDSFKTKGGTPAIVWCTRRQFRINHNC